MSIFSSIRFLDDNKEIVISENGKLPELDGSLLKNIKKLNVNSYENVGKLIFTNARLNADSTDGDVINVDTSMNVENESIDNLGNPLILRGNFIGNSENTVLLYTGDNTKTVSNNITTFTNIALNKDYLGDITTYNTSNILTYDNVPPIYGQNSEGHKSFGMDIYDKEMTIQYTNKFSEYVKVSYWYYISSTATIRSSVYFGLGSRNGAYYMGVFYYDVAYKKLRFFTRSDTLSISIDSLEKDKWHYVELCFKLNERNKAKVYHDGTFLGEETGNTTGSWNNTDGQILFRSITKNAFNFDQLMVNISSEEEYNNFENTEHPIPTSASELIKSTSFTINNTDSLNEGDKLLIKRGTNSYYIDNSLLLKSDSILDATNDSKGIVQIGSGINVSDGIISVDKNSIGLNNVDNTSDLDKPISNATKDSLNNKLEANNILGGSNISLSKSGNNITIYSNYNIANESSNGLMSNTDKFKLDGIQNNAEVNVINSIQVNGIPQPISDKTVNILVPDSSIFATKTELNNYLPLSGGSLSGSLIFNNSFYLNTNPTNNFNYVINTNINQNQSQLVLTINNNSQNKYTEWFFRDNTYTRYRHELNGGNGILTQFDLVSGEDENDNTSYANFNCKVISQNEFISTYHESYRIAYGLYGTFWKNDGTNLNLLITNANDQYGTYNDLRPFTVNLSTGQVILNNYFVTNSDGYTSIAGNLAISNSGITTNSGITVNGMIDCQNIVNAKTYFRKTSTTLNKNNTYAQNTYDNDLIFTDSENRTIFRIDTFLGPTNNIGARLLAQSRDSSVEAELAIRWRENNTPSVTWSYPTNGANNELARCDWVKNQINSISAQDVITVYSGKTGILNNDGTDTSWLQILFKKTGNLGIIYGSAQLSREACVSLRNNRPDLTNAHPIALSTKLYGYLPLTYTNNASELLTLTLPYYYDSSAAKHSDLETHTRTFVFGLSSDGNFLMSSPEFNGTNIASNDIIFIQFIGLCHV